MINFLKFKQGVSRQYGKAPHKPILILAVLKAFEKGLITENKIFITPELVSYFRDYWNALVKTGHSPNFALPFFHLKNEKSGLWHLKCAPGFENAITSSNSIQSLNALREYVYYASFDTKFFLQVTNSQKRQQFQKFILENYFNRVSFPALDEMMDSIVNEIRNGNPQAAQVSAKKVLNCSKEDQEEQVFIRSHSFKKQITQIYSNTCAISRLRVDSIANVSMIDACHIVPFSESHNDHLTNGIALSPNMHRAFDRGLISIDNQFKVLVSNSFRETDSTHSIRQFEGKEIVLPRNRKYAPERSNLEQHRKRFNF
jgi:putative restriction endonuclease